jgi:hypothetical protein
MNDIVYRFGDAVNDMLYHFHPPKKPPAALAFIALAGVSYAQDSQGQLDSGLAAMSGAHSRMKSGSSKSCSNRSS